MRYAYKVTPRQGGHFGRSSDLDPAYPPREQIGGLCTPCHDPHGVSPTLGADMKYSVPLLKGTWLTSPYKEDTAPIEEQVGNIRKDKGRQGVFYNIDQNTFSYNIHDTVSGITETDSEFGGLCLRCHPKADLLTGPSTWKSKKKIHQSVKGWGGYGKHNYSCSKCHTVHNARLPRLMITNCLDKKHKGFMGNNPSPIIEGQGSGTRNGNYPLCAGGQSTELGYCPDGRYRPYRYIGGTDRRPRGGIGGGHIPGNWHGGPHGFYYNWGESVGCHESQTGDDTDQSWNTKTEWLDDYTPELLSGPYVSSMFAVVSDVRATIIWTTRSDSSSCVDYGPTTGYGDTECDATLVTDHSITLTGLTNHSTYHYQVRSTDGGGTETTSSDHTFYISVGPTVPVPQTMPETTCPTPCAITLDWDPSTDPDSGPVQYYAEVIDGNVGTLYASGWTSDTDWTETLEPAYWCWKVRARDGNHPEAVSAWSEELCFNTIEATSYPTAPTLTPEPDIVSIDPVTVTLDWIASTSPLGHALEYIVQVDDAGDFSSINHTSGWISATTWNVTVAQGKTWYWRVRARDAVIPQLLSAWSTPDDFTITTAEAPPAPTLTPEGDVVDTGSVTVTLEWSTETCPDLDPTEYYVEIDDNGGFSSPITSRWISNTTWDVTLATTATWYWRVKARDSVHTDAVSGWSSPVDDFDVTGIGTHGGDKSCNICHGHDDGWNGNSYYGTTVTHSTHTEDDSDDLKGPFVSCNTCHAVSVGGAYYKDITIQSSQVEEDLTDFPVLFETTDTDLRTTGNGGHVYSDDGYDILFADGSGNKLSHEIINYEKTTGEYAAWVKVPSISSSVDTTIRMYYGDADITETTEDADEVWDSYEGVWHLEEDPSGAAPQVKDSTSYGHDGTSGGSMASDDLVDGKIYKALDFDGVDDIILSDTYTMSFADEITLEAWFKASGPGTGSPRLIEISGLGGIADSHCLAYDDDGTVRAWLDCLGGNNRFTGNMNADPTTYNDGLWHHMVLTFSDPDATLYIDGEPEDTVSAPCSVLDYVTFYTIGSIHPNYGSSHAFNGLIDEVRISKTDHTAGWIKTSYNNQDSPATFYTIGLEQAGSGPLLTYDTIDLGTTTVCNNCHSDGGVFDGAALARANWAASIYDGTMLQTGKEQWCATCHDDAAASSRKDGTGIRASNVVGDNVTYGYYVTGHNINCLSCHDSGKHHIDHVHRSYKFNESTAVADTPYVDSYRLKEIGGQPALVIPKPNRNPITNWQDFALCFSCHSRNDVLGSDSYDVSGTNFWDNDGSLINSHYVHMSDTSGDKRYDSDWDGNKTNESRPSCIACHNVHGSPRKVMMRHGELISTYGTTDKVPGLDFAYLVGAMPGTPDPTATLDESIGGRMGSFTAVCNTCHNPDRSYYRSPRLAPSVVNPNADPNPLDLAGGSQEVLFTCSVIDLSGSLYLDVVIDLTTLLGYADQQMYDDGTNGDAVAGDGIFSYRYIIPLTAGSGIHRPLITATNAYGIGTGEAELEITVPDEFVWDDGGADSNWSTPENWSDDTVPGPGDRVAFNHTSTADCVVDVIANNLRSITLGQGYNGTVTLTPNCVDGVSNELTLTEDLTVHSGTIIIQTDPTSINAASGGTVDSPHGEGIIINAANIMLASGAKISANSQGFTGNQGPGAGNGQRTGGSHGGYGGTLYSASSTYYPTLYGSVSEPTALGSGGGSNSSGGIGGGAIKLVASGIVTIDGTISANGGGGLAIDYGGGTGGSIWIISDTLAGTGSVSADGGPSQRWGYGGGGRVSLQWTSGQRTFNGTISAEVGGGGGYVNRGTIWVTVPGSTNAWDELWNATYPVNGSIALAAGEYDIAHLHITNNAVLECQGDTEAINAASGGTAGDPHGSGVTINADNVIIDEGSAISANYLGFIRNQGPGASGSKTGGANHGGGGSYYGLLSEPTALGSGGGSSTLGSRGGGAIKLQVSDTVTVNGSIVAKGGGGQAYDSGGGSGGSIWIISDTLAGMGSVSADGGPAQRWATGGAGGRVAVYFIHNTSSLPESSSVTGGTGTTNGEDGTMVWSPIGGYTEENIIPSTQCVQGAGGNVTISFKAKDPGDWVNGVYTGVIPVVPDVIVNDSDATFYDGTVTWEDDTLAGYDGDQHYAVSDAGGSDLSSCTWTPNITFAGEYKVYAWWTASDNRATDAAYTINHKDGSDTVDVNQEINGDQWNYLGTYSFDAGTSGTVVLTNDADEYVMADAVRFVFSDFDNNDTDRYTLYDFEYSIDGGFSFNPPLNGDSSGCLSSGWQDNSGSNYTSGEFLSVASGYSFTWDTLHSDMSGDLTGVLNNDVQVRFKVRNTVTQDVDTYYIDSSESLTSESFTVDNQ